MQVSAQSITATGVRAVLDDSPVVEVVADVARGPDALSAARRHCPDFVLVAGDGVPDELLVFLQQLRRQSPSSRIILFTDDDDPAKLAAVRRLSIEGYLLWHDVNSRALHAAFELTGQGIYVGSARPVEEFVAPPERRRRKSETPRLTAREESVLLGLDAGLRTKQIAERLHLSDRSVERAVASLQRKLGASSLFQLGARAERLGLVRSIKRREATED